MFDVSLSHSRGITLPSILDSFEPSYRYHNTIFFPAINQSIHPSITVINNLICIMKFATAFSLFFIAPSVIDAFALNEAKNPAFSSLSALPVDKTAVSSSLYDAFHSSQPESHSINLPFHLCLGMYQSNLNLTIILFPM